jgi:hypothetical protein
MSTFTCTNAKIIPDNKTVDGDIVDRPHSIIWRLTHVISFLIGGLTFIAGSCMYFANVSAISWALNTGGALFIVGSFFFLLADIQEFWYQRVGLFCYEKYREIYEAQHAKPSQDPECTKFERWERIKNGLNHFASIIGSALYLAGSILFLPDLAYVLTVGEALFIAGSAVIFFSQAWKVYRSGCTNQDDSYNNQFRFKNLLNDIQAVIINTSAGFGGFFYFIGTILFLPRYITTDFGLNRAAGLFVCGGFFFTVAGVFLLYRYFCSRHR